VFLFFFFCAAAATTATAAEGSLEVLDFDSRHSLVDFPSPRLASKRTGGVSVDDGGQQHDKRIWFEERVRQRQTAKAILPSCSLRQCIVCEATCRWNDGLSKSRWRSLSLSFILIFVLLVPDKGPISTGTADDADLGVMRSPL
jgi:hypothetical protein